MRHDGLSGALPLRPLTAAELLDSAVWLLRGRATVLLPAAAVLAGAEQLLLPAFDWAAQDPLTLTDWLRQCAGVGWGAFSIAVLGGVAARAAGAAVVGARLPDRAPAHRPVARAAGVSALAVLIGAGCAVAAFFTPLVWLPVYALLGLVVPVFVVDRVGPLRALGRGLALATRSTTKTGTTRPSSAYT
ncbi:MAG TPA: hypothetical protein VNV66_02475, partial [Pilimelia sp.]|nr:hypothetical protein [Pilimelia sp.]